MKKKQETLTPAEWKVMEIVWRLESCAARDVYSIAADEHGWAKSTVKTYLATLVKKGFLSTTRVGNSFLYRPKRPFLKVLLQAGDALLEKTLDRSAGPLIAHMVKNSRLTSSDIEELRSLLAKHKPAKDR